MVDAILGRGLIRIHPSPGGPVAALRGLDIRVESGEVAAVIGPSGSGKSTLLRLVGGLDRPSAGRIEVLGRDLTTASAAELDEHRRTKVGVVEQHYRRALSPYVPAGEAIGLPLALRGVGARDRDARVAELLERIGLPDRGGAYRHELSGGEQQRVAIARAVIARPDLLVADEPTGNVDPALAKRLLRLFLELNRLGTTVLIATHDARPTLRSVLRSPVAMIDFMCTSPQASLNARTSS